MDKNKPDNHLPYIDLNNITFEKLLSKSSGYGIVWSGKYRNKPCAIKMVILKSGYYYDKDCCVYVGENAEEKFNTNDKIPFLHTEFKKKRAMTRTEFKLEINNQLKLNEYSLTPKIYAFGKSHHIQYIQYGFIVMDLLSCSLRDIINVRKLIENEKQLLFSLLNKLHNVHKIVHGDLKPANIGVKLSENEIKHMTLLDCNRIKFASTMTKEEFLIRVSKDINYLKKTLKT